MYLSKGPVMPDYPYLTNIRALIQEIEDYEQLRESMAADEGMGIKSKRAETADNNVASNRYRYPSISTRSADRIRTARITRK